MCCSETTMLRCNKMKRSIAADKTEAASPRQVATLQSPQTGGVKVQRRDLSTNWQRRAVKGKENVDKDLPTVECQATKTFFIIRNYKNYQKFQCEGRRRKPGRLIPSRRTSWEASSPVR